MLPVGDALGAEVGDGKIAEREVEGGEGQVDAQCRVTIFAGQFAHTLGEGEGLFR